MKAMLEKRYKRSETSCDDVEQGDSIDASTSARALSSASYRRCTPFQPPEENVCSSAKKLMLFAPVESDTKAVPDISGKDDSVSSPESDKLAEEKEGPGKKTKPFSLPT